MKLVGTLVLLLGLAGPAAAGGQSDVAGATIAGTVADATGGALPGAAVAVRSLDRGVVRSVVTGGQGEYRVPALPPGRYDIVVSLKGFQDRTVANVVLSLGDVHVQDVELALASVRQDVVVTADRPLVEPRRTQQANTIAQIQIDTQPNLERQFTTYVFTLPGVTNSEAPRTQNPGFTFNTTGFSIGGSNGRANLVTVDGGENEYGSGQLRTQFSPEAIQEIQVNRNAFAAEFGFTSGTAVNVVTRSGTNEWRGSAYSFYRGSPIASRNVFDTVGPEASERVFTPGATIGGPVRLNHTFLFASYEWMDARAARFRRFSDSLEAQGPTSNAFASAELRSQAAYLAQLDASSDANIRRIAGGLRTALTPNVFPVVTSLLERNSGTFTAPDRRHFFTSRIDAQLTPRDTLTARISIYRTNTDFLIADSPTTAPDGSTTIPLRDYTFLGSWTRAAGSRVVNQLRAQFVKDDADVLPNDPVGTSLSIAGVGTFGRNYGAPFSTYQERYQFEDTLTIALPAHTVKLGGSYRPVHYSVTNELWFGGDWTFASGIYPSLLAAPLADQNALALWNLTHVDPSTGAPFAFGGPNLTGLQTLALGLPFLYHQGFNNPTWSGWAQYLGVFAQDSWQIGERLTLDYGARVDYDGEPAPLSAHAYTSPRAAVAWDVTGDRRFVARAGVGVYYAPTNYQVPYVGSLLDDSGRYINQILTTPLDGIASPPYLWAVGVALGKLPRRALEESDLRALGIDTGAGRPGRILFEVDPEFENPGSTQGSVGASWRLTDRLALDAGYVYYRGRHLPLYQEANYREGGIVDPLLGPRYGPIDPTIIQRNVTRSIGTSRYSGLTLSLSHPLRGGLQFQLNYTWARAHDDVTDLSPGLMAFLPTRLDREWARSTFDIRHTFVAQAALVVPAAPTGAGTLRRMMNGITVGGVVNAHSGLPFTLRIGSDSNGDTHGTYDRPYQAPRNSGLGPAYASVDLRVSRGVTLSKRQSLELILEMTNVFNRANYIAVNDVVGLDPVYLVPPFDRRGNPDAPPTSPLGFTAAADARQAQLGVRLRF